MRSVPNIAKSAATGVLTRNSSCRLYMGSHFHENLMEELKISCKSMYYERLAGSSGQLMRFKMTIVVCHFCDLSIFLLFFLPNHIFCPLVLQSGCSLHSKVHGAVIHVFVCIYMVCIQV